MSQVIELWIGALNLDNDLVTIFYTKSNLKLVRSLIFTSIAPCLFITNDIKKSLDMRERSVITDVLKIYANNNDITSQLSIIITLNNHKNILYALSESLVLLLNKLLGSNTLNDVGLNVYNLLSSALYISSLSMIFTSIPGELICIKLKQLSIYVTRSSHTDINITLQNISIYIADENESLLDLFDILTVGINTTEQMVLEYIKEEMPEVDKDIEMTDDTLNITVHRMESV